MNIVLISNNLFSYICGTKSVDQDHHEWCLGLLLAGMGLILCIFETVAVMFVEALGIA